MDTKASEWTMSINNDIEEDRISLHSTTRLIPAKNSATVAGLARDDIKAGPNLARAIASTCLVATIVVLGLFGLSDAKLGKVGGPAIVMGLAAAGAVMYIISILSTCFYGQRPICGRVGVDIGGLCTSLLSVLAAVLFSLDLSFIVSNEHMVVLVLLLLNGIATFLCVVTIAAMLYRTAIWREYRTRHSSEPYLPPLIKKQMPRVNPTNSRDPVMQNLIDSTSQEIIKEITARYEATIAGLDRQLKAETENTADVLDTCRILQERCNALEEQKSTLVAKAEKRIAKLKSARSALACEVANLKENARSPPVTPKGSPKAKKKQAKFAHAADTQDIDVLTVHDTIYGESQQIDALLGEPSITVSYDDDQEIPERKLSAELIRPPGSPSQKQREIILRNVMTNSPQLARKVASKTKRKKQKTQSLSANDV